MEKFATLEYPLKMCRNLDSFIKKVFGWNVRDDNTVNGSFDDTTEQVGGMWAIGRKPAENPGVMISKLSPLI